MSYSLAQSLPDSPGLGLFVDYIATKKGGPFSPVKRSFRINAHHDPPEITIPKYAPQAANKSVACKLDLKVEPVEKERTKVVRFMNPIQSVPCMKKIDFDLDSRKSLDEIEHFNTKNPASDTQEKKKSKDDMHDLCSYFQSTMKVDDATLNVDATNVKRISPMPKEGRFTILVSDPARYGNGLYVAVKRSVRTTIEKE